MLAPYCSSLWAMSWVVASTKLMMPTTVATPITSPARMKAALPLRRMRLRMDMSWSVIGSTLLGIIEITLAAQDVADLDDDRAVLHSAVEGRRVAAALD